MIITILAFSLSCILLSFFPIFSGDCHAAPLNKHEPKAMAVNSKKDWHLHKTYCQNYGQWSSTNTVTAWLGVSGPSVTVDLERELFLPHQIWDIWLGKELWENLSTQLLKRGKMLSYVTTPFTPDFMAVL